MSSGRAALRMATARLADKPFKQEAYAFLSWLTGLKFRDYPAVPREIETESVFATPDWSKIRVANFTGYFTPPEFQSIFNKRDKVKKLEPDMVYVGAVLDHDRWKALAVSGIISHYVFEKITGEDRSELYEEEDDW